jgi:uncharacterized protein (DUF2141 family)
MPPPASCQRRAAPGGLALGLAALLLAGAAGVGAAAAEPVATDCAAPGAPGAARLLVSVTGARSAAGSVAITLYGSRPEAFLARGGRLARQRVPLAGGRAEACFALSASGTYAVAVYHDENGDRDFNRSMLGLPAEGYGFSNDAPTPIGLPAFDAVRFAVAPGDNRMVIRLRY